MVGLSLAEMEMTFGGRLNAMSRQQGS
jgi:hypothetical protein